MAAELDVVGLSESSKEAVGRAQNTTKKARRGAGQQGGRCELRNEHRQAALQKSQRS